MGISKIGIIQDPFSSAGHLFHYAQSHQSKEHRVKIKQGQEITEAKEEVF